MDLPTLLSSLGIGGVASLAVLVVVRFIRNCLKVKCVQDSAGNMHLDISLKVTEAQKEIINKDDSMKEMLNKLNEYLHIQSRRNIENTNTTINVNN
jgi:hypothetical protein